MLSVTTNTASTIAQLALTKTRKGFGVVLERLSTGQRINDAADDAAGLAVASRMTSQILGLETRIKAASDAVGFVDTVDGALAEIANMY